jgi:hypothetical protein
MTQPQREASLDLIILSLFVDSHLSLKEDDALQAALDQIGWEGTNSREVYLCNAMNRARKAGESADATAAYIAERAKVLAEGWSSTEAVCLLASVLASDGVTAEETAFLTQVRAAMA